MQEFSHVSGLQGHTPRAILASKEEIDDVVVFTSRKMPIGGRSVIFIWSCLPKPMGAPACTGSRFRS